MPAEIDFQLCRHEQFRREALNVQCLVQGTRGRCPDAFGVPAIAKAENAFIIRHEIDFEFAEPHAANDLVFRRLHEPLLTQLVLELSPLRMSSEINDEIHVIGRPNAFEHDLVGNEKGCCATANKHQPLAQFISQRLRDRLQHLKQLA